jgi:hypothetical protein
MTSAGWHWHHLEAVVDGNKRTDEKLALAAATGSRQLGAASVVILSTPSPIAPQATVEFTI